MRVFLPIPKPRHVVGIVTNRWTRYLILSGMAHAFIWSTSLTYLKVTKPTFTSQWALILPGASFGVNFNLPDIGQASASNGSGMGSSTYDPRANYEYIFTSDSVLAAAAAIAKLPPDEFGKPRIKLLDNTTLMEFAVTGGSPEMAQKKSWALYEAVMQQLNVLRAAEIKERQDPNEQVLLTAQKKLEQAQLKVSRYKVQSGLSAPEQVTELSNNIEQLRRQQAETLAKVQEATSRLQKLEADVGLTSQQAADAFLLQSDKLFQQNLKDYSDASTTLEVLMTKFGPNHPTVIKETKRQQVAQKALYGRGKFLLNRALDPEILRQITLTENGAGRDTLFQTLVMVQAEQRGLGAEAKTLGTQVAQMEGQLKVLAERQSVLDKLNRDVQIAEALFASTIAKLDLGRGDVYSAYPLVQMAVEPDLPNSPTAPKKGIILAGSVMGSVFTTLGLTLLWIRKPWLKKLSKFISP